MGLVDNSEREDFASIIQRNGYPVADFWIDEREDTQTAGLHAITGTVTRQSNDKARQYRAGHGSKWLCEFDNELRNSVFGAP